MFSNFFERDLMAPLNYRHLLLIAAFPPHWKPILISKAEGKPISKNFIFRYKNSIFSTLLSSVVFRGRFGDALGRIYISRKNEARARQSIHKGVALLS